MYINYENHQFKFEYFIGKEHSVINNSSKSSEFEILNEKLRKAKVWYHIFRRLKPTGEASYMK